MSMPRKRTSALARVLAFGALIAAVGTVAIIISTQVQQGSVLHHILRDLGLACVVSAVVTLAYEVYARRRLDIEKIEGVLSAVAGSQIPRKVWDDIVQTLLNRRVIRREAEIRLHILREARLAPRRLVLRLNFSYRLASLSSRRQHLKVKHELDRDIEDRGLRLPRFEHVFIGKGYSVDRWPQWVSGDERVHISEEGHLTFGVGLPATGEGDGVPISITRRVIRDCPGSYYLVMTELTDGLRVYLEECPEDVSVELKVRPPEVDEVGQEVHFMLNRKQPLAVWSRTLLPGHAAELKLVRCDSATRNERATARRFTIPVLGRRIWRRLVGW